MSIINNIRVTKWSIESSLELFMMFSSIVLTDYLQLCPKSVVNV